MSDQSQHVFIPAAALFSPCESAHAGLTYVEGIESSQQRAIPFPIAGIDAYFKPVWAGQVATIVAQPSQYKTGLLDLIAREAAVYLQQNNRKNEAIVQVCVEETIEEKAIVDLARHARLDPGALAVGDVQAWHRLKDAAVVVSGIPIYRIGDSLLNPDMENHLYLSNVLRCLVFMRDELKIEIALATIDYLQALPLDPEIQAANPSDQQRRLQVRRDMYRIKKTAKWLNCPVWLGSQAKQMLSGARGDVQLPGMYDAEETSSIAQHTDRMITLWMPKMTHSLGSILEIGPIRFRVTEDLLFLKVTKQKGGLPSGKVFMCRIDHEAGRVYVDRNLEAEMTP